MAKRVSVFLRDLWLPTLASVLFGCGSSVTSTQFEDKEDGAVVDESGGETSADDSGTVTTDSSSADDSSVVADSAEPTDTGEVPPDTTVPPPDTTEPPPDTTPPPMDTALSCSEPLAAMYEGHCYFPINKRTWTAARDFCVSLGAHLATITSKGEQTFLATFGGTTEDRWIGLARPDGSPYMASSYKWVTAEAVSYANWGMGEPNFSGQCVRIRNDGTWADQGCTSNSIYGICEREP